MFGLRRALALTTAERYFALILSFALMSILSRLMTPAEIGISVLAGAVMTVFLSIRDVASSTYLIQKQDLQLDDQQTVFMLQFLFSAAIAGALVGFGPYLGQLFSEPRIVPYLKIAALCIVIESCGGPINALMRRRMDYGNIAIAGIVNAAVGAIATLVLALLGYGYMSFVGGWLVSSIVTTLTYMVLWNDLSMYRPNLKSWREVLQFGCYNGGSSILEKVVDSVPYIFLGRILPIDALALYNRSLTICQLPDKVMFSGVAGVLISAFSNHSRNGGDLKLVYLKSVENITALQWPALALIAIFAHPIVHILLGDQWLATIPLIQIIAIASMFRFSNDLNYPLLIAFGASRDVFLKSLIVLPASALILIVASLWGLHAAAWSAFIYQPFQAVVSILFNRRYVEFSWAELLFALRKAPLLVAASAAGPLAVVYASGTFDLSLSATGLAGILSGMGWLLGIWALNHPLGVEIMRLYRMICQRLWGDEKAYPAQ